MKYLTTYRGGTGWLDWYWPTAPGTADTTEWTYPPTLTMPLSKIYPNAGGQVDARRTVGYSYHRNGSLATRTWQRRPDDFTTTAAGAGVMTSYLYDAYARLLTIDYPAASTTVAATPDVGFTYDGAGRISTRTEAGQATTSYLYNSWGTPRKETVTSLISDLLSSVVERTYDGSNRPNLLKVSAGGTSAPDVDYNFDGDTGLLEEVVTDSRTITYGYNGIGAAPTSLTYVHSSSTLLSTSRPMNADGLVSSITHSQPSPSTMFQSMTYAYSGDRVTSMTRGAEEDNMLWDYRYDRRGQVASADKKFSNGEFAAGLQTEYAYDMAGNRTSKAQGGSATTTEGTGVRPTTYGTANALNQYTAVTNPSSSGTRWADVSGRRSSSTETIQVNGVTAGYQQDTTTGKHFRREVPLTATDTNNTNYAYLYTTSSLGGYLDAGYSYLPPPTETLTYDADGNLLSDGRWIYSWDAENRLAGLVSVEADVYSGYPDSPWFRWTFRYDGLSRRVLTVKEYFSTDLWDFVTEWRKSLTYDAWNPVHELKEDFYLNYDETLGWYVEPWGYSAKHYVWGPDIGSPTHGHTSWQKAGGVGGLLYVDPGWEGYPEFPLMDRLGNVTGYRRAVSGSPAALDAVYEYDAFGREVRSTGPSSDLMPFRFSTKYTDGETGLNYYGFRFYDSNNGRWLTRDPIGERGGKNLYAMVGNNPLQLWDFLGLNPCGCCVTGLKFKNNGEVGDGNGVMVGRDIQISAEMSGPGCEWSQTFDVKSELIDGQDVGGRHGKSGFDDFQDMADKIGYDAGNNIFLNDEGNPTLHDAPAAPGGPNSPFAKVDSVRKFKTCVESTAPECPVKKMCVTWTMTIKKENGQTITDAIPRPIEVDGSEIVR